MTGLLKQLFFTLTPKPRLPKNRAVILMYHSVSDTPNYFSAVTPEVFAEQMAYLAHKGYPVISLTELVRRLKAKEQLGGSVVITFDDGYKDNHDIAFPVLKKHNFPATIFVTTDLVGKSDKRNLARMSVEELKGLELSGLISIEPHTKSHPKLATLAPAEAREEIVGSKAFLEQALGKKCRFFATPYGSFSEETVRVIQEAGFDAATTVAEHTTVGVGVDFFRLPRVSVDQSTTWAQFRGKLSTAIDWYEKLKIWR